MDSQEVDIETYLFTFIPQITEGFTEDDKKTEAYKNLEKQLEAIVSAAYSRYINGEEVTKNFMYMRVIKQCLELAPTCFDKLMKSSLLNVKMLNKLSDPTFTRYLLYTFPVLKDSNVIDVKKYIKEKHNGINVLHSIAYDPTIVYFKDILEFIDKGCVKEMLEETDSNKSTVINNAIMYHAKFAIHLIESDLVDIFGTKSLTHPIDTIPFNKKQSDQKLLLDVILEKYGKDKLKKYFTSITLKKFSKYPLLMDILKLGLCEQSDLAQYPDFYKMVLKQPDIEEYKEVVKTNEFREYLVKKSTTFRGPHIIFNLIKTSSLLHPTLESLLDYHGETIYKLHDQNQCNVLCYASHNMKYLSILINHKKFNDELLTEKDNNGRCILYNAFAAIQVQKLEVVIKHKACKEYVHKNLKTLKKYILKDSRKINLLLKENIFTREIINELSPELIKRLVNSSFKEHLFNMLKSELIPVVENNVFIEGESLFTTLASLSKFSDQNETIILDKITKEHLNHVSPDGSSVISGIIRSFDDNLVDYDDDGSDDENILKKRLKAIITHKYFEKDLFNKDINSMMLLTKNNPNVIEWMIKEKYIDKDYFDKKFYDNLELTLECVKMLEKNGLLTEKTFNYRYKEGTILFNVKTDNIELIDYMINHKWASPEFLMVTDSNETTYLQRLKASLEVSKMIIQCKNVTPNVLMNHKSEVLSVLEILHEDSYSMLLESNLFTKELATFKTHTVALDFTCFMIFYGNDIELLNKVINHENFSPDSFNEKTFAKLLLLESNELVKKLLDIKYFTEDILKSLNLLSYIEFPSIIELLLNHKYMTKEILSKLLYNDVFTKILHSGISESISLILKSKYLDISVFDDQDIFLLALQLNNPGLLKSVFDSLYKTKEEVDQYLIKYKDNNAINYIPYIKNEEMIEIILESNIHPSHLGNVLHRMLTGQFRELFAKWEKLTIDDLKKTNQYDDTCVSVCCENMDMIGILIDRKLIDKEILMFGSLEFKYLFLEVCRYNHKMAIELTKLECFDKGCFNVIDKNNRNCLHYAAIHQPRLLRYLMKHKYYTNDMLKIDQKTNTVLHYAAQYADPKTSKFLIEHKDITRESIYQMNKHHICPLEIAAKYNHKMVKYILNLNLDLPIEQYLNSNMYTILHLGCRYNSNVVEVIGKNKKYLDKFKKLIENDQLKEISPIVLACQYNPRSLDMLIKYFDIESILLNYDHKKNNFEPYLLIGIHYQPLIINIFKKLGNDVFKKLSKQKNDDEIDYEDHDYITFRNNLSKLPNIMNKCLSDHDPPKMECQICYDSYENVQFKCGHRCCISCAASLKDCHVCQIKIESFSSLGV